ncbi:MAG: hypothetical protein ABI678_16675 [Kofleriaceae bacterium]
MPPVRFDRDRIRALLELAADTLEGEWLLIGGAVAAAWFSPGRTTEDIDLVGLAGTADERMALMELAAGQGLPVEAVNSAADFFVRRIPGWRLELVPFVTGARATIFRPSATLFLLLKIARLSSSDLEDCLGLLALAERIDRTRVIAQLATLAPTDDDPLRARREALARVLAGPSGRA